MKMKCIDRQIFMVTQVFRIFKLARVLKLARHSPGLQAIAYTLQVFLDKHWGASILKKTNQHSYKELLLLIFLILVSGIIFASLAYFIEIEEVCFVLLERSCIPQRISKSIE